MEFVVFVIGLFVGGLMFWLFFDRKKSTKPSGTFIIDFSDPVKDVCRIELDESLDNIYTKKEIVLRVKTYEDTLN